MKEGRKEERKVGRYVGRKECGKVGMRVGGYCMYVGCNPIAYKNILYNCLLPTLATIWRRTSYGCDGLVTTNLWPYCIV